MHDHAVQVIGPERTADAAFLPSRSEHEMLDDQLTAPGKQVAERLLAGRAVEGVRLLDLHPRQPATELAQLVVPARVFFLLLEQFHSGSQPFGRRDDGGGHW
jgi:hypothetical protein